MPEIGALLQRRYRIKQELGRGGMGAVYSAEDTRLNNASVAVKETFFSADDLELREQFEREATVLARLHHRALPGVRDHFAEGSGQFLVMEFVAGDDLGKLLRRERKAIDFAKTTEQRFTAVQAELQRLNARDNDLERKIRQERKLLLLQLENRLLRAKLQLPPADEDEE